MAHAGEAPSGAGGDRHSGRTEGGDGRTASAPPRFRRRRATPRAAGLGRAQALRPAAPPRAGPPTPRDARNGFPPAPTPIAQREPAGNPKRILFADEVRVGRETPIARRSARRGARPRGCSSATASLPPHQRTGGRPPRPHRGVAAARSGPWPVSRLWGRSIVRRDDGRVGRGWGASLPGEAAGVAPWRAWGRCAAPGSGAAAAVHAGAGGAGRLPGPGVGRDGRASGAGACGPERPAVGGVREGGGPARWAGGHRSAAARGRAAQRCGMGPGFAAVGPAVRARGGCRGLGGGFRARARGSPRPGRPAAFARRRSPRRGR